MGACAGAHDAARRGTRRDRATMRAEATPFEVAPRPTRPRVAPPTRRALRLPPQPSRPSAPGRLLTRPRPARARTGPTETFANPVLCPPQAGGGEPAECETQRFAIAQLEVWGVDPSALRNASVDKAPDPPSIRRVTSSLTNMSQVMFDGFSEYTRWYTPGGR